ncbi:MAG: NAD(P)/FAD-dependent oxidoreductase [Halarsenatibacteraceae bacterium]
MDNRNYDILIIGGGVIGTAIARELSKYNLSIALFEKETDVASGTSKANSGIIHAGYNALQDTLKGRLNIKSNPMFDQVAADLKVPFKRIGSLVVGHNHEDRDKLILEKERSQAQTDLDLRIIEKKELREKEPNLAENAVVALYAPNAGIISPYKLTIAQAENAANNGVDIYLKTEVKRVLSENNFITGINTSAGRFNGSIVINAAGLYADKIAATVGEDYEIVPRKGEYNLFDKKHGSLVNHVIFPMPSEKSKGILITPTVDGNLLLGPNSYVVDNKDDLEVTEKGLKEIWTGGKKLYPSLPAGGIISSFAGLRATLPTEPYNDDFKIEALDKPVGFIDVAGIQSPGLSSAPGIAELVTKLVDDISKDLKAPIKLKQKLNYNPELEKLPRLDDYKDHRKDWHQVYQKDKNYGEIVCRCEHVTKGEIIAELRKSLAPPTLDAIKRRTRAGGGRCQGGFCGPRIAEIIAEEFDISPLEVTKNGPGSEILLERVKDIKPDRDITYRRQKDEN